MTQLIDDVTEASAAALFADAGATAAAWPIFERAGGCARAWQDTALRDSLLQVFPRRPDGAVPSRSSLTDMKARVARFCESGGVVMRPDGAAHRFWDQKRAPLVLWGSPPAVRSLDAPSTLAIVGPRQATTAALQFAASVAAHASEVIVSGGANGVDSAAHEQAGVTLLVLPDPASATDASSTLPARLRGAAWASAWLTPYSPAQRPARRFFALRNWYIAACADRVLVVEGGSKSGARHTASAARSLTRPVFVPHMADVRASPLTTDARARGALLWGNRGEEPEHAPPQSCPEGLEWLRDVLTSGAASLDELAAQTGRGVGALAAAVLHAELEGVVVARAGRYEWSTEGR